MVVKGISKEDFSENWVGRLSNNFTSEEAHELFRKVLQQIRLGG